MADRRVVVGSIIVALSLAALAVSAAPQRAAAVEPSDSENRLDHPISDIVVLPVDDQDDKERILTIGAFDHERGVRAVRLLERERAWNLVAEAAFDLPDAEIPRVEEPWFVDLEGGTVAIIAASHWQDRTVVELVRATGTSGIETIARQTLARAIDSAGAADVDGDGVAELVVASEATACAGTTLQAMDAVGLALRPPIQVPYVLWRGVIGRFDDVPGDDLMTYAAEACPGVSAGARAHLITTRLADGAITGDVTAGLDGGPIGRPPVRVDMDGDGRHEAFAQSGQGVILVDPTTAPVHAGVAAADALLLSATDPQADSSGISRLYIVQGNEDGVFVETRTVAMDEARSAVVLASTPGPGIDLEDERSQRLLGAMFGPVSLGGDPIAWAADIGGAGCQDLFLPGTLVTCADGGIRPGPAWVATRPLALVGAASEARILIAAGIDWPADGGLPATPDPWAGGVDGRWRWGPSAPFTLAELRASDATPFKQIPIPSATLERTTSPEATINVSGFTGTRIFARAVAVDASGSPIGEPHIDRVLTAAIGNFEQRTVHRIDVPAGLDSGRDGFFTEISLAGVPTPDGSRADRWSVTVVPINDWGEVGEPTRELAARDVIAPTVAMEAPFLSAVWPFSATVNGIAEPGVAVVIEGIGPVELDRRGNFTVNAPLAPWPQTLTATATDASGNETVREVSVIGGIDYRRLPWGTIVAIVVIAAVAVSGFFGARRGGRTPSARPAGVGAGGLDDLAGPEIEELPPGQGLPSL